MFNKSQKKVIIILVVILLVTSLLAFLLSSNNHDKHLIDDNPLGDKDSMWDDNLPIQSEISSLTDENLYFTLQNIINDYYEIIANNDVSNLYDILEDSYKTSHNINVNNVLDNFPKIAINPIFTAYTIYYNVSGNTKYYFINGSLYNQEEDGAHTYNDNDNFLVIISNNHYVIKPLGDINNLLNYSNRYSMFNININNSHIVKLISISIENKLISYVNNFLNLLYLNPERAYAMLDSKMQEKYVNLETFKENRNNIYRSLSSNIFSYEEIESETFILYKIKDSLGNDMQIIESSPNNYQIAF